MAGLAGLLGGGLAALGPGIGMLGAGLGLGGSLFNANQQRHAMDQYFSEGDPYRSQLRAIQNDPDLFFKGPIAQSLARQADARYSSIFGNPAGSGTAQALSLEAMLRGYGDERDRLGRLGGLANFNAAYPGARSGYANANMGILGSLGSILGFGSGFLPSGGGGGGGGLSNMGIDSITNAGPFGLAGF